jgi:spore photoproduct lyase
MKLKSYSDKFTEFSKNALFQSLDNHLQHFIYKTGKTYRLTFQELIQLTDMAVDFHMWDEPSLEEKWNAIESSIESNNGQKKKAILNKIKNDWQNLKVNPSKYKNNAPIVKSIIRKVKDHTEEHEIFGLCPVASENTVCCNLKTIDAIQGCGLGCSYCSIQTFYEDGAIGIESNLAEKLKNLELDPNKNYHIGSGQSSDSLAMGNRNGVLDAQLDFARNNPNIILEFKTKTKNIDYFLSINLPPNILVCWSLNPQTIINNEEHFTASLDQRLNAARQLSSKGVQVGFHFHPIVHYETYEKDYTEIAETIISMFSPIEIGMVSMGTLTFIKPAIKSLRSLGIPSKVLQMPMADAAGKFSYPLEIKENIFKTVWNAFAPWHNKVFFYFCMEEKKLWQSVMGKCYTSNNEFEKDLFFSVSSKITFQS